MHEFNSDFTPHPALRNCHLQTLWSRLSRYRTQLTPYWQALELPDGDYIDLAWSEPADICLSDPVRPLIILFHGLEGSVLSPYADQLMTAAKANNWHAVTMHFRGCSGRLNRTHRAYHSGDTADALYFIQWLKQKVPHKPLTAAGFSLGGNMLVKLLGENSSIPLTAAVSVSAPLALSPSSSRIDQGFSRVYRRHLLSGLKRKVIAKAQAGLLTGKLDLNEQQIKRITNFRDFDDRITAPLHGFSGADEYYQRCSGLAFLPVVRRPLLLLHAADDPFTCEASIAKPGCYSEDVTYELSRFGGHVGFVTTRNGRPDYWLPQRIFNYLETQLCASHSNN